MQQLQTTVLKSIKPGINPIFVISPNYDEAAALTSLLSLNLTLRNSRPLGAAPENYNFFYNLDVHKFLVKDKSSVKKEELQASLKLLIEEGMDTEKLWGMPFNYKTFFDLNVEALFPDASFIFIYGTNIVDSKDPNKLLNTLLTFYRNNRGNSAILHINNIIYTPALVLDTLPFDQKLCSWNRKSFPQTGVPEGANFKPLKGDKQTDDLKISLDQANLLVQNDAWFHGDEILAIFTVSEHINHTIIFNKIKQYSASFSTSPQIHIIFGTDEEKQTFVKLLHDKPVQGASVHLSVSTQMPASLNRIIEDNVCTHILLDNLNLDFPLNSILSPFRASQAPDFIVGNAIAHKMKPEDSDEYIYLADALVASSVSDSIAFSKQLWRDAGRFDETLSRNPAFWDFIIRGLKESNGFAMEFEGKLADINNAELILEDNIIPEGIYKTIVNKYRELFESNLEKVIRTVSESQYLPQHEIIKLNKQVSGLTSILDYTKEDVRALREQKAQLESRLSTIEGRWHNRAARKVNHYKRIFFKENANSKTGFLKMLGFAALAFSRPGLRMARRLLKGISKKIYLSLETRPVRIVYLDHIHAQSADIATTLNYHDWMSGKLNRTLLQTEYDHIKKDFSRQPKISIIMPVYDTPQEYLKQAIDSVLGQLYDNWELCIADDNSPSQHVKRLLTVYSARDNRIKVVYRETNGHISANSNSALALATGEYVLLLDHDDLLTPHCLSEFVKYLNAHPDAQFVYSDEDKIDDGGTLSSPYFKPDWSPDKLMAINYITHAALIEKSLLDSLHGFREGFEGSQDYDLFLRVSEIATKIGHVPKILYHWRIHQLSVATEGSDAKPYAYIAAKKALEEALVRRQTPGIVQYSGLKGTYRINYQVQSYERVSIIIPTKDQVKLMQNTVDSIFSLTEYPDFEVIVLNNNSTDPAFFELMDGYSEKFKGRFRCLDALFPFNFSKLINYGVSMCTGSYVLMLNNDVEILQKDWITRMVSYAQQEHIGCVGVKLLFPDDTIQHAGTVTGLGGVAGHIMVQFPKDTPGYYNSLQLTTNYSAVTAACLMCRKETFEQVGGMDEFLEVEYNDVDFCLKFIDKGFYNVYVPDVTLYHYESVSRGHPKQNKESYERHLREVKYFVEKWQNFIPNDPFFNPNFDYGYPDYRINFNA